MNIQNIPYFYSTIILNLVLVSEQQNTAQDEVKISTIAFS